MSGNASSERHLLPEDEYISREVALGALGIKPQTLYAYVSRGWVRSVRQPGGGKLSLYAKIDVEKLVSRQAARSGHGAAAAGAMRWGEPIIPTSITAITPQGPRYRGHLASDLTRRQATFEAVADLLWTGTLFDESKRWGLSAVPAGVTGIARRMRDYAVRDGLSEVFAMMVLHLGTSRGTTSERLSAASPTEAGRQIIQVMTGSMGLLGPRHAFQPVKQGELVAEALLRILDAEVSEENSEAMQAMLVLLADHELSSAAFAARIAASAGALLHGCITAAIATHSGVEIGRLYDRIDAFISPRFTAKEMLERARKLQSTGVTPPGFNHPLYPRGDPRADHLLGLAAKRRRKPVQLQHLLRFLDDVRMKMQFRPRVEFGLIALASAMGLPDKTPGALATLARTAGWIAHVFEQRSAGFLLRPRAKYVGSAF